MKDRRNSRNQRLRIHTYARIVPTREPKRCPNSRKQRLWACTCTHVPILLKRRPEASRQNTHIKTVGFGCRRPRPSRCRSRTTADTPPQAASYLAVGSGDALGAAWTARALARSSGPACWFPRSFLFHVQSHLNQKTGPRHGPRPLVPVRAPERGPCSLCRTQPSPCSVPTVPERKK